MAERPQKPSLNREHSRMVGYGVAKRALALAFAVLLAATPAFGASLKLIPATHLYDLTGGFESPSDVAVSEDGNAYVLDGVHGRVVAFDAAGNRTGTIGKPGGRKGELRQPLGIAVGDSGRIYVADSGNHRIQIFSPEGSFVRALRVPGEASDPADVVVDEARGRCFVSDNANHKILRLELDNGEVSDSFGKFGKGKRDYMYPFLMARGGRGYLYIVDVVNTRVKAVTSEGKDVATIGGWGVRAGYFYRPKGVAVDAKDRVFVSDSVLGVVQVFDKGGKLAAVVGDPASGAPRHFKAPMGVFVNGDMLFVVESAAHRVSVFQLGEISGGS